MRGRMLSKICIYSKLTVPVLTCLLLGLSACVRSDYRNTVSNQSEVIEGSDFHKKHEVLSETSSGQTALLQSKNFDVNEINIELRDSYGRPYKGALRSLLIDHAAIKELKQNRDIEVSFFDEQDQSSGSRVLVQFFDYSSVNTTSNIHRPTPKFFLDGGSRPNPFVISEELSKMANLGTCARDFECLFLTTTVGGSKTEQLLYQDLLVVGNSDDASNDIGVCFLLSHLKRESKVYSEWGESSIELALESVSRCLYALLELPYSFEGLQTANPFAD